MERQHANADLSFLWTHSLSHSIPDSSCRGSIRSLLPEMKLLAESVDAELNFTVINELIAVFSEREGPLPASTQ